MALGDDLSIRDLLIGFALGFGAAALTPDLRTRMRPTLKSAVRAAMLTGARGRERLEELREELEDLVAEVQHELSQEETAASGARGTGSAG